MQIIIVGGGSVGFALAELLAAENQDVIVIEKNAEKIKRLSLELGTMVIEDNGASPAALERAGIKKTEILIAVTEIDEVNMISCMIAKKMGVPVTVARVRNAEYTKSFQVISRDQLGIDIFINPERVAALEMAKIIRTPNVFDTEYFANGKIKMAAALVDKDSKILNKALKNLPLPDDCVIVAIERATGEFIVPNGEDIIKPHDRVFFMGKAGLISEISWLLQKKEKTAEKITIFGGGRIGFQLAEILENDKKTDFNIKLIEQNQECCIELANKLQRTLVLQGDATDFLFLKEEGIGNSDVVVAATGDDRTNILAAVLAQQMGIEKILCEIINQYYYPIFHTLNIEHAISPQILTAAQIVRLVRKGDIISMSFVKNGKAEISELVIPDKSRVAHKKLVQINLPKGILVGAILRNEEVILPGGNDILFPGDRVIIIAAPEVKQSVDKFFASTEKVNVLSKALNNNSKMNNV